MYFRKRAVHLINDDFLPDGVLQSSNMPKLRTSISVSILAVILAILYSQTQKDNFDDRMAIPALDTPCDMVHTPMYETKKARNVAVAAFGNPLIDE